MFSLNTDKSSSLKVVKTQNPQKKHDNECETDVQKILLVMKLEPETDFIHYFCLRNGRSIRRIQPPVIKASPCGSYLVFLRLENNISECFQLSFGVCNHAAYVKIIVGCYLSLKSGVRKDLHDRILFASLWNLKLKQIYNILTPWLTENHTK